MKAIITISLKEEVPDSAGRLLGQRLSDMGYTEVRNARMAKRIELDLDTGDPQTARDRVKRMCAEVLANAVAEDFTIEFED